MDNNNDTLKVGDLVEVRFSNGYVEVGQIKEITNDANFNYVVHITSLNQEDPFNFPYTSYDVHCNLKDLRKITNL